MILERRFVQVKFIQGSTIAPSWGASTKRTSRLASSSSALPLLGL
jgi:hypothetical protein